MHAWVNARVDAREALDRGRVRKEQALCAVGCCRPSRCARSKDALARLGELFSSSVRYSALDD
jgi:hypothetical protein